MVEVSGYDTFMDEGATKISLSNPIASYHRLLGDKLVKQTPIDLLTNIILPNPAF